MNMYYIAHVLPPPLNQQVEEWKLFFRDTYGCSVALKSPAHITLIAPFWMMPHQEEALLTETDQFAATQTPFTLNANGFGAFRPRTIFVALQPNDNLAQAKMQLEQQLVQQEQFGIKKERRLFHPHITLATRDLSQTDFYEAWEHFEQKPYEASWEATGVSVLRHNRRNWDVLHTATFAKAADNA